MFWKRWNLPWLLIETRLDEADSSWSFEDDSEELESVMTWHTWGLRLLNLLLQPTGDAADVLASTLSFFLQSIDAFEVELLFEGPARSRNDF